MEFVGPLTNTSRDADTLRSRLLANGQKEIAALWSATNTSQSPEMVAPGSSMRFRGTQQLPPTMAAGSTGPYQQQIQSSYGYQQSEPRGPVSRRPVPSGGGGYMQPNSRPGYSISPSYSTTPGYGTAPGSSASPGYGHGGPAAVSYSGPNRSAPAYTDAYGSSLPDSRSGRPPNTSRPGGSGGSARRDASQVRGSSRDAYPGEYDPEYLASRFGSMAIEDPPYGAEYPPRRSAYDSYDSYSGRDRRRQ